MAMEKLCWSFAVLFIFCTVGSLAEIFLDVKLSKAEVNLGDDVQVTCHVQGEQGLYIIWVRKVEEREIQLGTNAFMNDEYKATGRYNVAADFEKIADPSNSAVTLLKMNFKLNITGVTPAESGDIGCKVPKGDVALFQPLTVLVPMESLEMTMKREDGSDAMTFKGGEVLTFDEGEVRNFRCRVYGSYPKPEVRILLNDNDVTDRFNSSTELLLVPNSEGLKDAIYEVVISDENMEIGFDFADKKLTCDAKIPAPMARNESAVSVNISLTGYQPQFLCDAVLFAKLDTHPFNISCVVRSDPPGLNFTFTWERTISSGDNETLRDGEIKGHYIAYVLERDDPKEVLMVLQIDRLFIQHFRSYYFDAWNALGHVRYRLELQQAFEERTYPPAVVAESPGPIDSESLGELGNGAAPWVVSSLAGTLFSLLLAIVIM